MRFAAWAIAALLVSPALAQEALEGSDTPAYEPGPYEPGAYEPGVFLDRPADPEASGDGAGMDAAGAGEVWSDEAARRDDQPGISAPGSSLAVRRPGEGSIEVTPLAPPGSDLDEGQKKNDAELLEDDSIGLLPEVDTLPKSPDDQGRSPPEEAIGSSRPEGVAIPIEPVPTISRPGVRLRELDKMTGRTDTVEIAVGETRQIGRLKIAVEACRSPETNDPHETFAFLKVWDMRSAADLGVEEGDVEGEGKAGEPEEAFSGWMFAQSPSLSALDHPRYDLWVISCTTSEVAQSSGSE